MASIDQGLVAENVVQTMSFFGTSSEDTWEFHVSQKMREGQDVDAIHKLVLEILKENNM